MLRNYIFLHLILTLLVVSQPSSARPKIINFDELEAAVNEELRATNTPGAAVAVVIRDRVVFAKGLGVSNSETGVPVTSDTLFRIASTTKMLTAAALVALKVSTHRGPRAQKDVRNNPFCLFYKELF